MNAPLSFSPIAATSSVEEAEHLFQAELADSRLLNAGCGDRFGVEMNGLLIGNTALSLVSHHGNYDVDNGVIDGRGFPIFGFGYGQASSVSFDDQQLDFHKNAVIFTNGAKVKQSRTAGSYEVLVKCPVKEVEARIQTLLDRTITGELLFGKGAALDHGIGAHAKSALSYILASLNGDPSLVNNPLIVANFEEVMLSIILSMPSNYSEELLAPGGRLKAPSIVVQAEEFMEASADLPITIVDVLAHTGGSRKALLANFRKYRGYSPSEFLTKARLKLAHQDLSNPSPTDTVTSIACSSGFSHLGRFSGIYRERYGVSPSETLRQAQLKR
jgi:AraC-like DNA-binding protein